MKIFKICNLKNKIKLLSFFICLFTILIFSKSNFESVKSSTLLFINNILPSLFPFIFFTELILNSDIIDLLSKSIGKIIKSCFKLSKNCTPAIITGFLCGYPMGSKTVSTLFQNNKINKLEATKLLTFVNNCNPIFILSTIGISVLGNQNLGILLIISHYISALTIAFFVTRLKSISIIHETKSMSKSFNQNNVISKSSLTFFDIVKKSILKSFLTLSNIFGFIIIFNLLGNIITIILLKLNFSKNIVTILSALFEISKGCLDVSILDINENIKICIISFLLGFSGLCIICQVYSTISNNLFNIKKLITYKFSQGLLSFIYTYFLLNIFKIDINNITVFKNIETSLTYSNFIEQIKVYYINSIFLIIIILCMFSFLHILLHKQKKN